MEFMLEFYIHLFLLIFSGSGRHGWWSSETTTWKQCTDSGRVSAEHSSVTLQKMESQSNTLSLHSRLETALASFIIKKKPIEITTCTWECFMGLQGSGLVIVHVYNKEFYICIHLIDDILNSVNFISAPLDCSKSINVCLFLLFQFKINTSFCT